MSLVEREHVRKIGLRSRSRNARMFKRTCNQQEVRLEGMRTSGRGQLAMETSEERDIRLETMSIHQRERLATETAEERESHGYSR